MTKPLRIGILVAAHIANAYCKALKGAVGVAVVAVGSRDLAKARAFATEHGIGTAHGSYDALLADPGVDAIYNPLPNTLHAEWSIKALDAGKHVLCEKPLTLSGDAARRLFDHARIKGLHLVEGFPYMAQPQTLMLRKLLHEKAIGDLKLIQTSFGAFQNDPANIRFNPTLGGGSIWDMGSYPVSLVRLVAGRKPLKVQALATMSAQGVDVTTAAAMQFTGGLVASITSSMAGAYHRHALITGDQGAITTTFLNHPPIGGPAELMVRRGVMVTAPIERIETADGNGFLAETLAFADMVRHGVDRWTGASPQESIDIAEMLAAIVESARTSTTITLNS